MLAYVFNEQHQTRNANKLLYFSRCCQLPEENIFKCNIGWTRERHIVRGQSNKVSLTALTTGRVGILIVIATMLKFNTVVLNLSVV